MDGLLRTVALVGAITGTAIGAQQEQHATAKRSVVVQEPPDYVGAPNDLESLVRASDVIVHGRITGSRPFQDSVGLVHTDHSVRVRDVLKASPGVPPVNGTIHLLQDAGEIDTGGKALIRVPTQPLQVGSEYILFLTWASGMNAYILSFGEQFVFNTAGGMAETVKASGIGKQLGGVNAADLMTRIRAIANTP